MEIEALKAAIEAENPFVTIPALSTLRKASLAGDPSVTAEIQDQLLAKFTSLHPVLRDAVVLTVGKALYALPELLKKVIGLLTDPDPLNRAGAAHAIGHMFVKGKAHGALLVPLLEDSESYVRYRAIQALGRTQHHEAVPLLQKFEQDQTPVRDDSSHTLGAQATESLELLASLV